MTVVNFAEKFKLFDDQWSPKVVAQLNDYQFKIARIEGEFVWHSHEETDEAFFVLEGQIEIEFRDRTIELSAGELYVVPKGVEHKPVAKTEAKILIVEPSGVRNTGEAQSELSAPNDVWV